MEKYGKDNVENMTMIASTKQCSFVIIFHPKKIVFLESIHSHYICTLLLTNIAMENGPFDLAFPIETIPLLC